MKPYKIRKSKNKKSFSKYTKVHIVNLKPRPTRGGARL